MYKPTGGGVGASRVSRWSAAGRVSEQARFGLGRVRLGERGWVRSGQASGSYGFGSGEKGFPLQLQSPVCYADHYADGQHQYLFTERFLCEIETVYKH